MKIASCLKVNLYENYTVQSVDQLEKDFLEFPPYPLENKSLTSEFKIVNVYGLGRSLYFFNLFRKCLFDEKYTINKNLEGALVLINARESLQDQKSQIKKEFSNLRENFKSQTLPKRFFIFTALVVLSPILVIASLIPIFYFAARFGLMIINLKKITYGSLGAFLPLVKDEEVIVIRPSLAKKRGIDVSTILSHEHIHFLQYKNSEFQRKNTISNPEFFIKKEGLTSYIIYLFEKNEVEARLHEIVLSYYRKFRKLPQELDEFIGMLLASHDIGPLLKNIINQNNFFPPLAKEEMYAIREEDVAHDFKLMLMAIEKENHKFQFVTEVMATMYGNLLKLYGDEKSSNSFHAQIACPNLYDRLYGG